MGLGTVQKTCVRFSFPTKLKTTEGQVSVLFSVSSQCQDTGGVTDTCHLSETHQQLFTEPLVNARHSSKYFT